MNRALSQTEEIARAAFAEIGARFPHLKVTEEFDIPVEISLRLAVQDGLKHEVSLGLQNDDELHMSVGHFWCEWFPCTDPDNVRDFIDAVSGFLAGTYRSLEHYRGTRCFKAQLQRPTDDGWQTIATWSRLRLPSFRRITYKAVVNA
ncbi:conserved hypothetical protein [Luteimonas sp. 9C]|nr:conserved hypothetical protein [Luteimonas sp. 9C]